MLNMLYKTTQHRTLDLWSEIKEVQEGGDRKGIGKSSRESFNSYLSIFVFNRKEIGKSVFFHAGLYHMHIKTFKSLLHNPLVSLTWATK